MVNPVLSALNVQLFLFKLFQVSFVLFQHFIVQTGKRMKTLRGNKKAQPGLNQTDCSVQSKMVKICWLWLKI